MDAISKVIFLYIYRLLTYGCVIIGENPSFSATNIYLVFDYKREIKMMYFYSPQLSPLTALELNGKTVLVREQHRCYVGPRAFLLIYRRQN
jgi:hypothetical protein